jgi:DUF971 family protein
MDTPRSLDLKKDRGLTIEWADGTASYYSILYLRKMSPSADARQQREEQAKNPLAVLPQKTVNAMNAAAGGSSGGLVALSAEIVGNYALKIAFSDGHSTGLYSWSYLRSIDPAMQKPKGAGPGGE